VIAESVLKKYKEAEETAAAKDYSGSIFEVKILG
jgi:hypothetical protein